VLSYNEAMTTTASDDSGISEYKTHCLFCGEAIEPLGADPCGVVLVTQWDQPTDKQHAQQLFCHAERIRTAASSKTPIHVLDREQSG